MIELGKHEDVLAHLSRIIAKSFELEKVPRDYGTGDLLYHSEIHTLHAIGVKPGLNVTQLAALLGVTKGAVSQVISKLSKKGLVDRYKEPENNKQVLLALTQKGQKAYSGHVAYHKRIGDAFFTEIGKVTDEQIEFLRLFFNKFEAFIDRHLGNEKELEK